MIEMISGNLVLVSQFGGLLALAWLANFAASVYYNVNILDQKFDKARIINGLFKLVALCVGIASFVVVITAIPILLNHMDILITEEFADIFSIVTIIGVFVTKGIFPYCKQAYETFTNIIEDSTMK